VREFAGKVAVVTGGASGIGRAIAERLAREGMKLVLADVEEPALQSSVDALKSQGADAIGVVTDVSRFESVQELERRAVEAHGKVHVLCNNAGVGAHEDVPVWELPLSDWRWTLDVNLWGVIHGVKAFVPGMLAHGEEGHVVNTSSGNGGLILIPSTPIYSTSKSAVSTLTEALHLQLVQRDARIRASVLYPGPNLVSSNIFSASRNRTAEYAREVPQVAAPVTLEAMRTLAKQAGITLETTAPEEVAEHLFAGLRDDAYFILPMSEDGEARFRARMENVLERRDPEPPRF
jgi:NAD(P)-dependent dehydrogenase (short-subunit alcohol dehydrogenase family)